MRSGKLGGMSSFTELDFEDQETGDYCELCNTQFSYDDLCENCDCCPMCCEGHEGEEELEDEDE